MYPTIYGFLTSAMPYMAFRNCNTDRSCDFDHDRPQVIFMPTLTPTLAYNVIPLADFNNYYYIDKGTHRYEQIDVPKKYRINSTMYTSSMKQLMQLQENHIQRTK